MTRPGSAAWQEQHPNAPTRAQAEADAAGPPMQPAPCDDCGKCLRCLVNPPRRPWDGSTPLVGSNPDDGRLKSPRGSCHDCGRLVSGERRYCGRCAARRDK